MNICRVTEWAQKHHIQSKGTVAVWCLSAAAGGKALQSCGAFSMFLKVMIYQFPFFLPLCLTIKELQKAIDNRKAIILSINLCSSEFTQSDSEESKKLQERLSQMNVRWEHVCSMIEDWRSSLQDALIQCQVCTVHISNCQQPIYWKYRPFSYLLCSWSMWKPYSFGVCFSQGYTCAT